jgi:sulfur carrier protein ThiS
MRATVNGVEQELPDGLTVSALLDHLGVRRELLLGVPGDVLEIVSFVGGG